MAASSPAQGTRPRAPGRKPDIATLGGLLMALGGIVGGLILEGGAIKEILNPTAALIVFGGTLGAVMVTTPQKVLVRAAKQLGTVLFERAQSADAVVEEIIVYATKARKHGIVSLEQDAAQIADPFLNKAVNLAVDGTDPQEIRKMMEVEIGITERDLEAEAKVYEAAGGYAPTIGIIGAVIGLIQVMKNLANIDEVGHGIATAFVATIYGVGAANVFFLPAGNKIRARGATIVQMKELMLEGVIGIVEGLNPKLIRGKLEVYLERGGKPAREAKAKAAGVGEAAAAAARG